ncbi:Mov34/MPN/PAD-1 family protein [Ferrimonas kyonanensis]|uniref:Mov34/MPN/PAD-1 family protein n=1 Tax=Ferrimonas kyonanensis TaxID=364763 RepID=UPI00041C0DBE|nr:Mov34/MPN/PAD-1 family protein [Ferrimonas kyonanensis]
MVESHIEHLIHLIGSHGRVVEVLSCKSHQDNFVVEVVWKVMLPSRCEEDGCTPVGIREMEPVTFQIPRNYQAIGFLPFLRSDFPRDKLPHINPTGYGTLVSPCIYEGSLSDLIHQRGVLGVLDALQEWLDSAAQMRLMDREQGWEPVLFPNAKGTFSESPEVLNSAIQEHHCKAGFSAGLCSYIRYCFEPTPGFFRVGREKYSDSKEVDVHLLIMPESESSSHYQNGAISDRESLEEFVSRLDGNVPDNEFGLIVDRRDALSKLVCAYSKGDRSGVGISVLVIAVKRPFNLLGQSTPFEIIPFILRHSREPSKRLEVIPLDFRSPVSYEMLKKTSFGGLEHPNFKVAVLGCGSVGSKIAMTLGKTGAYSFSLCDKEGLAPHNLARHALCDVFTSGGFWKAEALSLTLSHTLGVDVQSYCRNLTSDPLPFASADTKLDAVIETTGSASVSSTINTLDKLPGRLIQTGLYGKGQVGYLAFEPMGDERNPNIGDLEALFFQFSYSIPRVRSLVFNQANFSKQVVGPGCSSLTTVAPDYLVSLQSSSIAAKIDSGLTAEVPEAKVMLSHCDRESWSLQWHELTVPRTRLFTVAESERTWSVRVLGGLADELSEQRRTCLPFETGGVLVGHIDLLNLTIYVCSAQSLAPSEQPTPTSFVLDQAALSGVNEELLQGSEGYLQVLGTWHSHPHSSRPSSTDLTTMRELSDSWGLEVVLMLIVGEEGMEFINER